MHKIIKHIGHSLILLIFCTVSISAQERESIIGKWDLNVQMKNKIAPSWLEVKLSGTNTLVGYFVEYNGSARPISEVYFQNGIIDFSSIKTVTFPEKYAPEGAVEIIKV